MYIRTRSTHRIPLQKDVPAVGPGRRAVLPLDVVREDDRLFAVDALVVRRVISRGSLGATSIELRCFDGEVDVLIILVLDGVGLDAKTDDSHPFVLLRRVLDRPVYRYHNLNVVKQKVLRLARLVFLPETDREAAHVVRPRRVHFIRE